MLLQFKQGLKTQGSAELEPLSPGECKARCVLVKNSFLHWNLSCLRKIPFYFLFKGIYGFRISLKYLSVTCELGLFRKCCVPNLNGQSDNEHPGSLGCAMELGTTFAFASDSSMRKVSPMAGWASKCLLIKNYFYLESVPCKNVEICCCSGG